MMRIAAVIPTCRKVIIPEQSVEVNWFVVHDQEEREVINEHGAQVSHIIAPDKEMYGEKCSSIRSLTTDDDCFLPFDWAEDHITALRSEVHPWSMSIKQPLRTRGLPYLARNLPVAISHGLWDGVPDIDGQTQMAGHGFLVRHEGRWDRIHPPFAMSSMNFGFRREVMPVMYQPAQGGDLPYDRFDDIWLGLMAQRVLQAHGYAFLNGGACVYHTRASDAEVNAKKEAPGLKVHERFWQYVWAFQPEGDDLVADYQRLTVVVAAFEDDTTSGYFRRLADNMREWLNLVQA
jgi:hypothetical protein